MHYLLLEGAYSYNLGSKHCLWPHFLMSILGALIPRYPEITKELFRQMNLEDSSIMSPSQKM